VNELLIAWCACHMLATGGALMGVFGNLKVRIDPWAIDYGSELPLAGDDIGDDENVDAAVEAPAELWAPIRPNDSAPRDLVFVDGIRRLELRLMLGEGGALRHGALGAFAVGAANSTSQGAAIVHESISRLAIASGGVSLPAALDVAQALIYEPHSTHHIDPDAPMRALHEAMRTSEERVRT